ncbi:Transmembrane protein [Nymphaea thermarum]|nr:Transmembrane protein [Nymphaea thermarum]
MEEVKSAIEAQLDFLSDLFDKVRGEIRSGSQPAIDNFIGFFHAIDWKEPWLISLLIFHVIIVVVAITSRKHSNFQMILFLLALGGVYLAENINHLLGSNWRKFAGQNYFDPNGLFLSVLWSGPLLIIAIIILVNTLFNLCYLIVRWKKAELKHRARLSRDKQE